MREGGERARSGKESQLATLSDIGISRSDSSRWQQIAELPQDTFEIEANSIDAIITPILLSSPFGLPVI